MGFVPKKEEVVSQLKQMIKQSKFVDGYAGLEIRAVDKSSHSASGSIFQFATTH